MSAIVVFRQSDRISLLTDGAAYTADAVDKGFNTKVASLPHLHAAVAVRGSQYALALIAGFLSFGVEKYDDIRPALQEAVLFLSPDGNGEGEAVEVVVAGWSEALGADSFLLVNHDHAGEARKMTPTRAGDVMLAPGTEEIVAAVRPHLPQPYTSADQLDPETHGLIFLEAQRRASHLVPGQEHRAHIVGGFAQLTTIFRDRIETRVIRRWPDAIGEKINPGSKNVEV